MKKVKYASTLYQQQLHQYTKVQSSEVYKAATHFTMAEVHRVADGRFVRFLLSEEKKCVRCVKVWVNSSK